MSPGKVYLRKFIRDKTDDLVEEVDLVDSNLHYATIKYSDGKESTVSTKDLAPWVPDPSTKLTDESPEPPEPASAEMEIIIPESDQATPRPPTIEGSSPNAVEMGETGDAPVLRRSTRASKPPQRLSYDRF